MDARLSLSLLREFDAAALQQAISGSSAHPGPSSSLLSSSAAPATHHPTIRKTDTTNGSMTGSAQASQPAKPMSFPASKSRSPSPSSSKGGRAPGSQLPLATRLSSPRKKKKRSSSSGGGSESLRSVLLTATPKIAAEISDRVLAPQPEGTKRERFVQFNMAMLPEVEHEPSTSAAPTRSCFKGSRLAEEMAAQNALFSDFPEEATAPSDGDKAESDVQEVVRPLVGLARLCDVSVRQAHLKDLKKSVHKQRLAECRFKPAVDKHSLALVAAAKERKNAAGDAAFHSDPLLNVPVMEEQATAHRLHITPRARRLSRTVDDLLEWGRELQESMSEARLAAEVTKEEPEVLYRPGITPRSRRIAESIGDRRSTVVEHAMMHAAANSKQAAKRRDAQAALKERNIALREALAKKARVGEADEGGRSPSSASRKREAARKHFLAHDADVDLDWWMAELKKDTAFSCNQITDILSHKKSLKFV
jgi:hypothetical protein